MTTIIDGSAGITFPNGGNPQAAPAGIIQVVQGTLTTSFSTSSTSLVSTGLTASITPKFSTSKIFILVQGMCRESQWNQMLFSVYRNGANVISGYNQVLQTQSTSGSTNLATTTIPVVINMLDSPATTSSTSYTLYTAQDGGNAMTFNYSGGSVAGIATITLMEIAQ